MGYIGSIPADKYQTLQKQSFTTSATDTYTLSYAVTNPQDLALFINNVRQNPNDAYTVSGTTLTLSAAITGSDTMYAVFLGKSVETIAPALSSVTNDMLAGSINESKLLGSISNAKLANSSITLNGSAVSLGGSATIGGGKIGQVIQTVKTDVFSTTSTSFVDVTGLTASITPSATSSKILVTVNLSVSSSDNSISTILFRNSTQIALGDASGSKSRSFGGSAYTGTLGATTQMPFNTSFLDSPNTTSATTYKIQGGAVGGGTLFYGRGTADTDNAQHARTVNVITLMEVLA